MISKKITLGERINKIRLILQRPYFIMSMLPSGDIMFILEGIEVSRLSFRGHSIEGSVRKAERHIENESKMGTLKIPKTVEEEKAEKEEKQRIKQEEEDVKNEVIGEKEEIKEETENKEKELPENKPPEV